MAVGSLHLALGWIFLSFDNLILPTAVCLPPTFSFYLLAVGLICHVNCQQLPTALLPTAYFFSWPLALLASPPLSIVN